MGLTEWLSKLDASHISAAAAVVSATVAGISATAAATSAFAARRSSAAATRTSVVAQKAFHTPALLKILDMYNSEDMNKSLKILFKVRDIAKGFRGKPLNEDSIEDLAEALGHADKEKIDGARRCVRRWVKMAHTMHSLDLITTEQAKLALTEQNGYVIWADIALPLCEHPTDKTKMEWAHKFLEIVPVKRTS